jgi:hypothetical protein
MWNDTLDDFEITPEEEEAIISDHVKRCTKADRDEYCKVCLEM